MCLPLVGNEFKNQVIDEILEAFNIERSLSMKGCPYDNAVAEATYKVIKAEFVNNQIFGTVIKASDEITAIDGYVTASNGKIYKKILELDGKIFCENNYVILRR